MERISAKVGKEFIQSYHYSKGCHNGPLCYGLLDAHRELIGVCAFACPASENVRSSIFGEQHKDWVFELHRLAIYPDNSPKGTATWFMKRTIAFLQEDKPELRAIVSFADSSEGHVGTIYKAANFL